MVAWEYVSYESHFSFHNNDSTAFRKYLRSFRPCFKNFSNSGIVFFSIVMGEKVSESSNVYEFVSKLFREEAIVSEFVNGIAVGRWLGMPLLDQNEIRNVEDNFCAKIH